MPYNIPVRHEVKLRFYARTSFNYVRESPGSCHDHPIMFHKGMKKILKLTVRITDNLLYITGKG